ncbi:MAG: EthD family reductase [Mycobacteriales bacterium]
MYKCTVLYGHPDDADAFDRYYTQTHIPIARGMEGLTGWTITRLEPDADGNAPAHHLVAELCAESREALLAIFDSPEGRAASADVHNFATGGATYLFGPVDTILPTPAGRD